MHRRHRRRGRLAARAVLAGLLLAALTVVTDAGPAHATAGVLSYAGRAGSFGTLGSTTPVDAATTTSVSVGTGTPAGWGFRPGQAAWLTTLAGNGDLVVAQDRFVVIFDTFDPSRPATDREAPFAAQEFTYTPAAGIVPTTYAFRSDHATDVGFESALYDSAGNLWLAQRHRASLAAAPLARYTRTELANCTVQWGWWNYYGNTCAPRDNVASAAGLGYSMSLDEDPVTHDLLNTTLSGYLQAIRRTGSSPYTFSQRLVVNLGINNLRDRNSYLVSPRKATVDGAARRYYIPVQLLQNPTTTGSSCGWWKDPPVPCAPPVLDQWLITVDLQALLGT